MKGKANFLGSILKIFYCDPFVNTYSFTLLYFKAYISRVHKNVLSFFTPFHFTPTLFVYRFEFLFVNRIFNLWCSLLHFIGRKLIVTAISPMRMRDVPSGKIFLGINFYSVNITKSEIKKMRTIRVADGLQSKWQKCLGPKIGVEKK